MPAQFLPDPLSILITGASSGIGAALAREYSARGVTLALTGRDRARLDTIAKECRARGATVVTALIDVVDRAGLARFIADADRAQPLDLVIANAGISSGLKDANQLDDHVRAIFAVNVEGLFNTVNPAAALMAKRGRGQIALMASLAGFRGLPGALAYGASKAAVRSFGEGLRGWLGTRGVAVNVICPGYVKSPMTARNRFPMPFLIEAEHAATIIRHGLARNKGRIAFPWPMYALVRLIDLLPNRLVEYLLGRMPHKD